MFINKLTLSVNYVQATALNSVGKKVSVLQKHKFGGANRKVFIYLWKVLAQWPRGHGSQRQMGALLAQNDKLRAGKFFGKEGPIPDCIPEPTGELKKKSKVPPNLGAF